MPENKESYFAGQKGLKAGRYQCLTCGYTEELEKDGDHLPICPICSSPEYKLLPPTASEEQ